MAQIKTHGRKHALTTHADSYGSLPELRDRSGRAKSGMDYISAVKDLDRDLQMAGRLSVRDLSYTIDLASVQDLDHDL